MMTAQYQAALHSYAEGRYEEAMQQFSELLYEDPRNPKLHIWLGATFRKAGKMEYAKVQYQQVLTLTDDPDLLDLASTSLAQIQSKIANHKGKKKDVAANSLKSSNPQPDGKVTHTEQNSSNNVTLLAEVPQGLMPPPIGVQGNHNGKLNGTAISNGFVQNGLGKPNDESKAPIHKGVAVPPPPVIAALMKEKPQNKQEESPFIMVEEVALPSDASDAVVSEQVTEKVEDQQITEKAPSSFFGQAIANIQNSSRRSQKSRKSNSSKSKPTKSKRDVASPISLGELIFGDEPSSHAKSIPAVDSSINSDNTATETANVDILIGTRRDSIRTSSKDAIALEDMFKFSSIGQKITLWGALMATIPAIVIGVTAYQVGNGLLLEKVKQERQAEAINLAKVTSSFLKQQIGDIGVLKKLLASSTESGQNTLQNPNAPSTGSASRPIASNQKQVLQQLTNRLNLYSQAYPSYSSIAAFSSSGEFLAQSSNSKTLQMLNPNLISKVANGDKVILSEPIAGKNGVHIYAIASIKNPVSQKVGMILQAEIPLNSLVNYVKAAKLNNDQDSFYLVDSLGKYVAASQPVTFGGDASEDFTMLPELRSSQLPDLRELSKGDRKLQMLAYAPIPNMQSYGISTWDLLTTVDKSSVMTDIQNLLFVVGAGIAATPLVVAAIAYALSRSLSSRLKDIRAALYDLRRGDFHSSFGALSVEGNDELADISLSINRMSEQFQVMMQKQEQEKQRLQLQVVKLFQVLSKLARDDKEEIKNADLEHLSDEMILNLGKKVRSEMVQHYAEVENYRQQKDQLKAQLMQMLRDMQSLADGDLLVSTRSIDGSLTDVAIFFDDVTRGLQNIVSQVKTSANQVNFALSQNDQAIANLSSVSQRQVDIVTRSLNTMQAGSITATAIADNSQRAVQSSQAIVEKITSSDQAIAAVVDKVSELQNTVANTAKRVKHLGEVSQKITKAISFVNEIAIQTNFLAINASLEASRNGHTDISFAVVAEEVGELANRSIVATKEMEEMLSDIQQETSAVMSAVESGTAQVAESASLALAARDNLHQIGNISHEIDELMSSIASATAAQVQTSEGVANLMQDISHIAQRTLANSGEVSKSMKSTKTYSSDLQKSLAHFKS